MNDQEKREHLELTRLVNLVRTTQLAQFATLQGALQAFSDRLTLVNGKRDDGIDEPPTRDDVRKPHGRPSPIVKVQTLDDLIDQLDSMQQRIARLEDGR